MAPSGEAAVIGQRLGKTHADARADAGREPDEKSLPTVVRGKSGGEQWCQRRNRAVHQANQTRLNDLQEKQPFLLGRVRFAELGQGDPFGGVRVVAFLFGEISEQLADAGVGCAASGGLVKSFRFHLHALGGFLDGLQTKRAHEPDGAAVHEPAHVLTPDERHVITEAVFVKFQQAMAMTVLLMAHDPELFGRLGIIRLQTIGEVAVDAGIFLFQ